MIVIFKLIIDGNDYGYLFEVKEVTRENRAEIYHNIDRMADALKYHVEKLLDDEEVDNGNNREGTLDK